MLKWWLYENHIFITWSDWSCWSLSNSLICLFTYSSTSLFVFCYALFYYYRRSNMSGMLQSVQFFGYTLLACYVFFLMLGTVAFVASLKFIRYIYVNLKMDWFGHKTTLWQEEEIKKIRFIPFCTIFKSQLVHHANILSSLTL